MRLIEGILNREYTAIHEAMIYLDMYALRIVFDTHMFACGFRRQGNSSFAAGLLNLFYN